jgi:hypothetical protein
MLRFFILLIRGLIAVRWSACLKIRAGRATGLQSLALQFLSFRRGRQCPRFTIVSPHSGDCGARPVTRSVSALLTRSSHRRLNGFSGVSQYRVEDGPPPLLQRSRPKVPVDYSLIGGSTLVAGFHTSWSLCARAGLVPLRQTFVRRCQNCVACPLSGLQKPTVGGSPRWFPWMASPTSRAALGHRKLTSPGRERLSGRRAVSAEGPAWRGYQGRGGSSMSRGKRRTRGRRSSANGSPATCRASSSDSFRSTACRHERMR